jgi:membrane-associated protease RseP (regulator of RpoE activity)
MSDPRHVPIHRALPLALLLALLPAAALAGDRTEGSAARKTRVVVRPSGHGPMLLTGKRGFLGVDLLELTKELRRHFQADEDAGVLVSHIEAGSPAANAGLEVGDVLTAIDGKPVKSSWSLRELIAPRKGGDVVTLDVVRDGSRRQLQATLAEREGRVLELGGMLRRGDGEGDVTTLVIPDGKTWEAFGEDMGRWGEQLGEEIAEAFDNPDVRWRVEREWGDREQLQKKIEALERRLRELEKRLQEQHR